MTATMTDVNAPAGHVPRASGLASTQVRGSALLLIGRVLAMLLGVVTQLLLVRVLSKDDFGAFSWGLSIVTVVQAFVPLGLDRIDSKHLALSDERGDDRRLVGVLLAETMVISVTGSIVFVGTLALQSHLYPGLAPSALAANLLVLLVLLAPLGALDTMVLNAFAVFAKSRSVFFRRYVLEPSLRLSAVAIVLLGGGSLYDLTLGYILAAALGMAIYGVMLVRLLRKLGVLRNLRGRVTIPMRELLIDGLPLLTSTLVYAAINAVPALYLGAVGNATDVANLRAIAPIATVAMAASTAFAVLYLPTVTRMWERGDHHGVRISYWRTALWVSLAAFPALLMSTAYAGTTTVTLLGERYASSAPLLAICGVGYFFQSASGFSAQILTVAGRRRYLFWTNALTLLIGFISSAALIPTYGALGAAWATTITLVTSNVLRQLGLRGLPVRVFDLRVLAPYILMIVIALDLAGLQSVAPVGFVVAMAISSLATLALLLFTVPWLDVPGTFPELMRLPVFGGVLRTAAYRGHMRRRRPSPYHLGYIPISPTELPGEGPAMTPAAGNPAEPINSDPRVGDPKFLTPTGAPVTMLEGTIPEALRREASTMAPGEWMVAQMRHASGSPNAMHAAAQAAGLVDVTVYWEAPNRSRRSMLVPMDSPGALRAALRRNEGSLRGRIASRVALLMARVGLISLVTRDLIVVGKRPAR